MEELIRQLREQYKLQSNLHVKLEDFFSYTDSVVKKGLEQYINNSPNNPNFEIFQKLIKENTSEVENILQDTFRAAILDNRVSSYEDFMNISPQIFSHKIKEFNTEIQHSDISDNIYEEASVDIINTIINVDNDFKRKCEETIFHRKNLDSSYKTSNEILNNIHNRIINIDVMVIEEIKKMDSIPNIEQLKYSRNKLHSLSNELENNNNLRSFSTKNENNVSSSDMSNPSHSVNQTLKDKLRNAKGEKVLEENITSKQSNPIKSDKEPQQTVVSKESSPTQQSLKDRLRNAQGNKESEDSSVLRPKR